MDISKFTESVRYGLQSASTVAKDMQHQQIDVEHFFLALLQQDSSLAARILSKLNMNPGDVAQKLKGILGKKPKVQDTTEQFMSQRLAHILTKSQERAKKMKDD